MQHVVAKNQHKKNQQKALMASQGCLCSEISQEVLS